MKLSKEELKKKISDSVTDGELAISLLEDIEDSMLDVNVDTTQVEELQNRNTELQTKYDDLLSKYKERFLTKENEESNDDKDEGLQEKEIIDIKEI